MGGGGGHRGRDVQRKWEHIEEMFEGTKQVRQAETSRNGGLRQQTDGSFQSTATGPGPAVMSGATDADVEFL